MRAIRTRSGSVYKITGISSKGLLEVRKDGMQESVKCVAIFPDRLPCFEATRKWGTAPDGRLEGFNDQGVRTLCFVPRQVRVGMLLVSARGFRSTEIVAVE